jgi:hypothetical protein
MLTAPSGTILPRLFAALCYHIQVGWLTVAEGHRHGTTIEELEKRVAAPEGELRHLRQKLGIWIPGETPEQTAESQAAVEAAWARVKKELGILSRGIIEMREE